MPLASTNFYACIPCLLGCSLKMQSFCILLITFESFHTYNSVQSMFLLFDYLKYALQMIEGADNDRGS